MENDRKTAAALVLTHAAMALFYVLLTAIGIVAMMVQGYFEYLANPDPALLAIFATFGGVQGAVSIGVLLVAAFETLAAYRALNGESRSLRTGAALGLALSVLMLPGSLLTCSSCGCMYWPILIGISAGAFVLAQRASEPPPV